MKKKLFSMVLVAIMVITVGCGNKKDSGGANDSAVNDIALEKIHTAVKDVYGEDYVPNMPIDETVLKDTYGIESSWCEEVIAEGPMMSTNVDNFIAIKATEGNIENVTKALEAYHEVLLQDTLQYPMNLMKIKASKVVSYGDYAFFIMLGIIPMEVEEEGDEAMLKASEAENQKAIDVIEELLLNK